MNLFKSLVSVSIITIFSRILGFIRDTFIAHFFGASVVTDAFFISFKLPNILRRIFAEGAFSQSFIPILGEYKNKEHIDTIRNFISYVAGLLILILFIITVLGILVAPWIIYIIAPGFIDIPDKFDLTVRLFRITFPYILFISLVSFISSILNTWNKFSVPAFSPILLNISMIMSMLFLVPYCEFPILALSWGVFIGGILQLLYQIPFLKGMGLLVLPRISMQHIGVLRVIKLMGSAIIGVSISQISLMINTVLASFLESGSISWIYYADRLMEIPSGILGSTIGTILLPSLSKSFSTGNYREYQCLINWGLRLCFLLALPCTIVLAIFAKPLIISLFQYGNFSSYDTTMTFRALIAYCIGLMGLIIVRILATVFYSRKDIKTPIKIAFVSLILTQLMNIIFIKLLQHVGLILSISLSACINAFMLYWQLLRQGIFIPSLNWGNFLLKLSASLMIMTIILVLILQYIPLWEEEIMLIRISWLLIVFFIGIISYFIALFVFGFRLRDFSLSVM
ncbi:putative peptidoglycan biosynthesis protein MurJ [Candidatus Arsenophonus lipoptenae]|uniref:Probable lipid II flippase MurJ n=1 Tax=Candidatus Arsenophonus lipoptenae TaxID=634113 RepID=A0A0X9W780_9GAMM|nr:murein biosynthesis integral membrane protein MurJ [Candidatus Arsenophonus lipoptenae]AMA65137.1 putative peptidoglycan biosynthesis protein MurJ [Candidatus Arsenophonus lipoptenae]